MAEQPITDAELGGVRARLARPRRGERIGLKVVRQLIARVDDAEGEGCTLHGHAPHGQEAEELRKGIEAVLVENGYGDAWRSDLQRLLDRVAARDSLAHLRANEELAELKAKVEKLEALFQQTHGCHWSWVARGSELERERDLLRARVRELGDDLRRAGRGEHIIGSGGGLLKKFADLFETEVG